MSKSSKIDGIYELTVKKKRRNRNLMTVAVISFGIGLVSGFLFSVFGENNTPLISQPLYAQITMILALVSILVSYLIIYVVQRFMVVPFEKENFLKVYNAHKCLERYDSLKGSASQEQSDFDKAVNLLYGVSLNLKGRGERSSRLDIGKEINATFSKVGELIQNRILPNIQQEKESPQKRDLILELADTLADVSFERLYSLISNLEKLPKSDSFKPKPSFLQAHSTFRSVLIHVSKFFVSVAVVMSMAFFLSNMFQKPISDFGPYILTSIFVLFVAWEFKSREKAITDLLLI
jgi:xanthosine utilization system XapX-like protein